MQSELSPFGGAIGQQSLAQMSGRMHRQTSREIERVVSDALVIVVHEQGRAHLADTALNNAGALSALEQHLIQVAPLGEARYKQIVDAYTLGASIAIARW